MKILAVIGSPREDSLCFIATNAVLQNIKLNYADIELDLIDLRETPLPFFSTSEFKNSEFYPDIARKVIAADAFLLATPDFHGSMSGILKNFLDHFWQEFAGKLFAYICASNDKGLTAMDHIRTAVRQCYAWSMPYGICISRNDMDDNNSISNPDLIFRLSMLARDLSIYAPIIANQRRNDLNGNDTFTFLARIRNMPPAMQL